MDLFDGTNPFLTMTDRIALFVSWPIEMRAMTAASFVDEPSVDAFLKCVGLGIYPAPSTAAGTEPKWYRHALERAVAKRHRLMSPALDADVMELI